MFFFQKSSFSVDMPILNNASSKKVAVSKSNFSKELPILKKCLLGRSFEKGAEKREHQKKNSCSEEIAALKKFFVDLVTLKI